MSKEQRLKLLAVNSVLSRLGEEMVEVLKFHLSHHYSISLGTNEQSSFSLEEFHFALQKLLGEGGANIILEEIRREIDRLSREQLH
jgi:hypothetical protein